MTLPYPPPPHLSEGLDPPLVTIPETIAGRTLAPVPFSFLKCQIEKCDVTKTKICEIMGLVGIFRKNKLVKNRPISANWCGDISTVMFWWFYTNPCHITVRISSQFALTGWFLASGHFSSCPFWIYPMILWRHQFSICIRYACFL